MRYGTTILNNPLPIFYSGLGTSLSATGGTGYFLKQNAVGAFMFASRNI